MTPPSNPDTNDVTYWDYLQTDTLLNLQKPVTQAHDEMLFIVVHQTFELWFKLAIYELNSAIDFLAKGNHASAVAPIKRVVSIFNTSVKAFETLVTMTPSGYMEFRDSLVPASGFQSVQFRIIEILLGFKPIPSDTDSEPSKFYWESALQAGKTYVSFKAQYHAQLVELAESHKSNNIHDLLLTLTESATGKSGVDAYIYVLNHRDEFPVVAKLADAAHELQQSLLSFRQGHHVVTRFSIGDAAGTSDSHNSTQHSCASYLQSVIQNHAIVFPELENALVA